MATVVSLYSRKAYEGKDWDEEKIHLQKIQKGLSYDHWRAHVGATANNGRVVMRVCENVNDPMYCGREPRRRGWLQYEPKIALKQLVGRAIHETWTLPKRREALDGERPVRSQLSRYRKKRTPSFKPGSWLFGARARVACDDDEDDPDPENLPTRLKLTSLLRGRQLGGMGHLGIDPDVNIRRIEARVSAEGETKRDVRERRELFHCFVAFRNLHSPLRAPSSRASSSRAAAQSRARGARGSGEDVRPRAMFVVLVAMRVVTRSRRRPPTPARPSPFARGGSPPVGVCARRASPALAVAFFDARRFSSLGSSGQYAYGSSFRDLPCTSPLAPFLARYVSALCRFSPRAVLAVRAVFDVLGVFASSPCARTASSPPSSPPLKRSNAPDAPRVVEIVVGGALAFPRASSRSSVITSRPPSPRA